MTIKQIPLVALVLGGLGLGLLAPPAARAQEVPLRQYTMLVVGGYTSYDAASALRNAPYGGVEGQYNILPNFAIGGFLLASRPVTDETMFPMLRIQFVDTVFHILTSQQVTQVEFGLQGTLRVPMGRIGLEGTAGVGRYMLDLDQQRADRPAIPGQEVTGISGNLFVLGGGATLSLGEGGGVRFQVRDVVFMNYDREPLGLWHPLFQAQNIPHPRGDIPETKSTIHNLRYEISFSFSPRGGA